MVACSSRFERLYYLAFPANSNVGIMCLIKQTSDPKTFEFTWILVLVSVHGLAGIRLGDKNLEPNESL